MKKGNTPGVGRGSPGKAQGSSKALGYTSKESEPYLQGRRDALAELKTSGGVARSQLALQVLFCLPDEFVKAYEELFDRATSGDLGAVSGKGVEFDKGSGRATGKKNGIVLGSERASQAMGGGKKFKPPTDLLGGTKALDLKTAVDKELDRLAGMIGRGLRAGKLGSLGASPRCKGSNCGRFLRGTDRFCSHCGTRVG